MIKLFNYIKNLFLTNDDKIDILCVKLLRLIWNRQYIYLDDVYKLYSLLTYKNEDLKQFLMRVYIIFSNIEKLSYKDLEYLYNSFVDCMPKLEYVLSDIIRNAKIGLDCSKPIKGQGD